MGKRHPEPLHEAVERFQHCSAPTVELPILGRPINRSIVHMINLSYQTLSNE